MKTVPYGRILFGASAVLFGVICLLWHDAETWQSMHRILRLPAGTAIGTCLMIAQIAGGVALPLPRAARAASIVLGVVYLLFSFACVAGIIAAPRTWDPYSSFFEQFSLLCGTVSVYALIESRAPLGRAARLGLGLCAVSFTVTQAVYLRATADLVPPWILPNQMFWAIVTTVLFALAALAMLINVQARAAMRLMSLMIVLFGIIVWIPAVAHHPQAHFSWSELALTFLIAGASWVVADLKRF